jgi:hypothetical protein
VSAAPTLRWRGTVVPTATALLCAAALASATLWAAKPVYGPLHAEFAWSPAVLAVAAALSLAITTVLLRPLDRLVMIQTGRAWACGGLIGCGLAALLVLPTLTHLWQFVGALVLLGPTRAAALLGLWRTLRLSFQRRIVALLLLAAAVLGIWPATALVGQTIYRNSWREGVATAAGLLLLAAPLAYVLLPGREGCAALDRSASSGNDDGASPQTLLNEGPQQ